MCDRLKMDPFEMSSCVLKFLHSYSFSILNFACKIKIEAIPNVILYIMVYNPPPPPKHIKIFSFFFCLKEHIIYHFFEKCHLGPPRILKKLVPTESGLKIRNMYQIRFLIFCWILQKSGKKESGST